MRLCHPDAGPWEANAVGWLVKTSAAAKKKNRDHLWVLERAAPEPDVRYVVVAAFPDAWVLRSDDRGARWKELLHVTDPAIVEGNLSLVKMRTFCGRPELFIGAYRKLYFSPDRGETKKVVKDVGPPTTADGEQPAFSELRGSAGSPRTVYAEVMDLREFEATAD
ncbi:MAG: hypothetical protein HYZ75_08445 [Elusimicrobia bacterium]|nr:hypothetical protein [Elusimicrobiota bacterium]